MRKPKYKERNKQEAIEIVKEILEIIPLKNIPEIPLFGINRITNIGFVYINNELIGMPKSPNARKKAKELIKEFKITKKDLLDL